jgi:Holliday junction resolvase
VRRAAKIDANQKQIVDQLRKCGFTVLHLHTLGKGAPDIAVGAFNKNYFFEIKDAEKPKSKKKLTEDEEKFHQTWNGQISIIESIEDALHIININKN